MSNYDFLLRFQCLQYTLTQNKLIDLGFASVGISNNTDSPYFNNALVSTALTESEIFMIKDTLGFSNRKPAIYFENTPELAGLKSTLEKSGYKKTWEDCWMFHDGKISQHNEYKGIIKVDDSRSLELFLATLNDCYRENDPLNPYGQLGGYIESARSSWIRHKGTNRVVFYMLKNESKIVAVAILNNFAGLGYISSIASTIEERGKGHAKVLADFCEKESRSFGNQHHVLVTEKGHYPNVYYEQAGLKTKFTALGYTLEV